ncbi:MAG: hypothetical protein QM713_05330 [Arachnia sp.]
MIEYSLTRDDIVSALTSLAALRPKGALAGSSVFGGPKKQAEQAVKASVLLLGPRRVWADDEGLHEWVGDVEQVHRWAVVGRPHVAGAHVVVPLTNLSPDAPAFAGCALIVPRSVPGLDELAGDVAVRAEDAVDEAPPRPGVDRAGVPVAELVADVFPEDYAAVNTAFRRSAEGRRQIAAALGTGLVVGALAGLILTLLPGVSLPVLRTAAVGGLLGVVAVAVLLRLTLNIQSRHFVETGVYKVGPGAWWFDRERFHEEIDGRHFSASWRRIERIQRVDDVAVFWLGSSFAILVPCRDDDGRLFVSAAERRLAG